MAFDGFFMGWRECLQGGSATDVLLFGFQSVCQLLCLIAADAGGKALAE